MWSKKTGLVIRYSSPHLLVCSLMGGALSFVLNIWTPAARTDGLCAVMAVGSDICFCILWGPILLKVSHATSLIFYDTSLTRH